MPELIVKLGDSVVHKYFFDKEVLSIGRAKDNDIVIENLSVSRNHARVRRVDNKYILTDLNSANGTYVNNVRVNKTDLCHDDIVTIGKHQIHFINVDLSDEQVISDAFGAERTMIVDKTPVARLVITKGKQQGQEFKITKTETYIGRSSDNDIRLHDWFVSKKHAMILRQGQNFFIKDLKSWRGTMVNGKFTRESSVNDGDTLQFGSTIMTFHITPEEEVLKITGRVPKELVEAEEQYEAEEFEEKEEEILEQEEVVADEGEFEEKVKAEEEEVAAMQAAWEPLEHDEEKHPAEKIAGDIMIEEEIAPELLEQELEEQEKEPQEAEVIVEELVVEEEEEEPEPEEEEVEPEPEEEKIEPEPVEAAQEETPATPSLEETLEQAPEGIDPKEVEMWLKALNNPSRIIRKNAARFLKKLTGKDYDYE